MTNHNVAKTIPPIRKEFLSPDTQGESKKVVKNVELEREC